MKGSRPLRIVGVVVAVLVLTIVGIVYWQSANHDASPASPDADVAPSRGPRVAVLPFLNASGDPDQDYFAHGLTEDIITELSKLQGLSVIAHRSTFEYKGKSVGARQVGADLGVRYVLEGSVRRAGERIRVNAQLSDASDGMRLWADSFERDSTVTDLFSLQDELTQQVVNAIAGSYGALSRAEIAEARRKPPASLDSYDCVLRAYEYLQVHSEENHFAARDCLEKAVERDPDYTDAWAWLAYLYGDEFHHQWNPRPESYDSLDKALEAAEHAVRLDQTSQVAHAMLGTTYRLRRELDRFRVEADRAIAINPNNALWLGLLGSGLTQVGDWERGIPLAKRAFELNPNPPPWIYMSFFLDHYRNRRYEEALAEAQRAETEDYRAHVFRVAAYGQLGRAEEAQGELSELREQFSGTPDELRQALLEQYGFTAEMVDHMLEGLAKAGLEVE